jgi:hypothetical protein
MLNTVNTVSVLATIAYPDSEVCAPVPFLLRLVIILTF